MPQGSGAAEGERRLEGRAPSFLSETAFRIFAVSVVLVTMVFGLQSYYPSLIGPISNVLPAAGASAAFLSALLCWKRYGFGSRTRFETIWLAFTLGTALWVLAELTWATYYFVLAVPIPYPSVADVFYVSGYFPMIGGLALYLGDFAGALSGRRLLAALLAIGASVTLALGLVVPVELSQGFTGIKIITDLAYPLLDLTLLSLTILCLAIFLGGSISKWWFLLGGAGALYVIGDEYFLYQVSVGSYYNGSVDDLFFILGYFAFAIAFYAHRREF